MKTKLEISIYLTWSKIIALIILVLSFVMDFFADKKGTVFMFAIPFIVFLITGKQFLDRGKEKDTQ